MPVAGRMSFDWGLFHTYQETTTAPKRLPSILKQESMSVVKKDKVAGLQTSDLPATWDDWKTM